MVRSNGDPQFVQPRHMRVNKPRNVDDDDLLQEDPPMDKPLSEPTTMSYYIQRIKIAEICRRVVDVMPLSSFELGTVDYQEIINLDEQFEAFFQELPPFFRIDNKSLRESVPIVRRYPHLQIQRYAVLMIAHTRRCKLHQPFLIRRSMERHYDYSREMSLKSARSVIQMKDLLREEDPDSFASVSTKHTGIIYHIFMATVVLVMDLCFNKAANGEDDAARKAEVVSAFQMMEEARSQSRMANEFLESLMDVLRKHKVRLHSQNILPNDAGESMGGEERESRPFQTAVGVHQRSDEPHHPTQQRMDASGDHLLPDIQQRQPYDYSIQPQDISQHYLSDFDAIWKEYVELGPNMDMPEWDSLFSDLDSRF